MKRLIDLKSALLGALFGVVCIAAIGAAANINYVKGIDPVRFLVLEATPEQTPVGFGGSVVILKVSPHYGKISQEALDFRLKHETQEISMVVFVEKGYEIKRGDIIDFKACSHLKLSPGSRILRHLPSGGAEWVP